MNMFWGSRQVVGVYWGDVALWTMPVISIISDIDGGLLSEVAAWVDEIPIIGPWLGAGIALIGDLIQFLLPPGIAEILGTVTSVMRSEGTTATDDNFIEVTVGSTGYKGLITDVLAHYPDDGTGSQGIGFRLMDSTLAIVQRAGGISTVVEGCGLYQIGDVLRFETHASLQWHQLFRNGQTVGFFDDLGGMTLDSHHRTVALSMQAEVATANGARSTSPNFTRLVAGDLQTNFSLASGGAGSAGGSDAPTITGGDDPFVFDVSADPGSAGSAGGADHTWSMVLPAWWPTSV